MGYANQSKAMCNPQPRTTYVPPSVYDKLLKGSPSMDHAQTFFRGETKDETNNVPRNDSMNSVDRFFGAVL
jgi:hypothetical protein